MIVKKCDICGAEMRITTPRYKFTFDGWFYTKEKDICIDCFKRIADEKCPTYECLMMLRQCMEEEHNCKLKHLIKTDIIQTERSE